MASSASSPAGQLVILMAAVDKIGAHNAVAKVVASHLTGEEREGDSATFLRTFLRLMNDAIHDLGLTDRVARQVAVFAIFPPEDLRYAVVEAEAEECERQACAGSDDFVNLDEG